MDTTDLINGGYWLDRVDNGDSRSIEAALSRAVNKDHPCTDWAGCDIARARAEGFTYVAAWLLIGATECPTMGTLMELFPGAINLYPEPAGFKEWLAFHRKYGVKCDECGGYTYGHDTWIPEVCSGCLAALPATVS